MTTCKPLMTLGFILLFGIAPLEGCLAADGHGGPQARMKPCPQSPNCVSSLERDERHAIQPIVYSGSPEDAREALLGVLKVESRAAIVATEPDSIHAEFKSRVFGFVDDVAFFFPAGQRVIHVRSASRTGYYDFGANRKRIERIRRLLEAALLTNTEQR